MALTRKDLHNLFIEQQEIDKNEKIKKIVHYMKEIVIKNAKKGQQNCMEYFDHSINKIKDEILNQLKEIFPDCLIECGSGDEYVISYPKRIYISINWD